MMTSSSEYRRLQRELPAKYQPEVRRIANDYNVTRESIFSPTRGSPEEAAARQAVMLALHTKHKLSFTQIGKLLGRNRKTVAHGVHTLQ